MTEPSAAFRQRLRAQDRRILLAFSGGKDAIACWHAARLDGFEVAPVFFELIPGLEFVDDAISHYEKHFGVPIRRYPHPSLFRMLNNFVFQPPERLRHIERRKLKKWDYNMIHARVRRELGWPSSIPCGVGVRAADSPQRRIAISTHGPLSGGNAYLIWDWRIADVLEAIRKEGCGLPVDYELFNRSFDGIDYRFLRPIKDRFPRDYERILSIFPLADLELWRYERCGR